MRFLILLILLGLPVADLYITSRLARWTGVPLWILLTGSFLAGLLLLRNERNAFRVRTVAALHGEVSREMWNWLWPDTPTDEVPISHVTNGVHMQTWLGPDMTALLDRHMPANWRERRIESDDVRWPAVLAGDVRSIRCLRCRRHRQLRRRRFSAATDGQKSQQDGVGEPPKKGVD